MLGGRREERKGERGVSGWIEKRLRVGSMEVLTSNLPAPFLPGVPVFLFFRFFALLLPKSAMLVDLYPLSARARGIFRKACSLYESPCVCLGASNAGCLRGCVRLRTSAGASG